MERWRDGEKKEKEKLETLEEVEFGSTVYTHKNLFRVAQFLKLY